MERKPVVIIRKRKQEKGSEEKRDSRSYELNQVTELRQRFGITRPELVARALRIPEDRAQELIESGV